MEMIDVDLYKYRLRLQTDKSLVESPDMHFSTDKMY